MYIDILYFSKQNTKIKPIYQYRFNVYVSTNQDLKIVKLFKL